MGQEQDVSFGTVPEPDESIRRVAEARQRELSKPVGSLGRLESLGAWISACQGQCPPRPFTRPRAVLFAGDHGVVGRGVSAAPAELTRHLVANALAGTAAVNIMATTAGVSVRVVDMSVDGTAGTPEQVGTYKVRHGSGSIDREDALTEAEAHAAVTAGIAVADQEIDGGADLLVVGDIGIGSTTPAAVLVAALTGNEPVAVVGRGGGIDDTAWMRKAAAIRDALRRARRVNGDPIALLRTCAGADIAALAAFLAQAAIRKTPVVLDGVATLAAALVAEELAPGARRWWVAGHRDTEPAHALALTHLELTPLVDFGMSLGEGSGAVATVPLLTMAVRVLSDMATAAEAGFPGQKPDEPDPSDTTPNT